MTKREKRLEAIKKNPRGVRPDELAQVLEAAGFIWQKGRGKGDHRFFRHPAGLVFSLDYGRNPVRKVYVEEAIALVEEAGRIEAEKEE